MTTPWLTLLHHQVSQILVKEHLMSQFLFQCYLLNRQGAPCNDSDGSDAEKSLSLNHTKS